MCLFASVAQARYFPSGDTAMSLRGNQSDEPRRGRMRSQDDHRKNDAGHRQYSKGAVGVPVVRVERDTRFRVRAAAIDMATKRLSAAINDQFLAVWTEAEALWVGW